MEQQVGDIHTMSEPPETFEGVVLSELGKKNYIKLLNRAKNSVIEPPHKKCQKCQQQMDWRTTGQLQKQKNG
ncbi:hypothetical protein HDV05_001687, partial [Chytridiales sp. JEL 0842]